MIVVDTNVIAYLFIQGDHTGFSEKALRKDPEWIAPVLWKSEFRNVLSLYLRKHQFAIEESFQIMREAEELMRGGEFDVNSTQVLKLAKESNCSAYDCEFITLAQEIRVPLITLDNNLLAKFPNETISLEIYGS